MLNCYELVDIQALQNSLNSSHSKYGGYSKHENGSYPGISYFFWFDLKDLLHSYMGLSGMCISGRSDLKELNCEIGVSSIKWVEFLKRRKLESLENTFGIEFE